MTISYLKEIESLNGAEFFLRAAELMPAFSPVGLKNLRSDVRRLQKKIKSRKTLTLVVKNNDGSIKTQRVPNKYFGK